MKPDNARRSTDYLVNGLATSRHGSPDGAGYSLRLAILSLLGIKMYPTPYGLRRVTSVLSCGCLY